jgi:predicted lipoprotein
VTTLRSLWLVLALALIWEVSPAQAETDQSAIAKDALINVIRPGYAAFADATTALDGRVQTLCDEPSPKTLDAARQAFAEAVKKWSPVEIFRFGPVNRHRRYDRLFFWPDPKGVGLRQIQKALADKDESVTLADTLADKSVALQGFPALEYLLYADGAKKLADGAPEIGFRCSFAASVATNMDRIAHAVTEGWRDGADFTKTFLSPGSDDPLYHSPKDVTLELFKAFTSGLELVRDQKLGKPLGTSPETARPMLAAFWRSDLTFPNMVGNLEGVRALFDKGGFSGVVAAESPGVEDSILFDIDHATNVLSGIDQPIAQVVQDDALRAKLEALRVVLKSARETASTMIARGAGLSFGFNALDGD